MVFLCFDPCPYRRQPIWYNNTCPFNSCGNNPSDPCRVFGHSRFNPQTTTYPEMYETSSTGWKCPHCKCRPHKTHAFPLQFVFWKPKLIHEMADKILVKESDCDVVQKKTSQWGFTDGAPPKFDYFVSQGIIWGSCLGTTTLLSLSIYVYIYNYICICSYMLIYVWLCVYIYIYVELLSNH